MWPLLALFGAWALFAPKKESASGVVSRRQIVGRTLIPADAEPVAIGVSADLLEDLADPARRKQLRVAEPPLGSLRSLLSFFGDSEKASEGVDYLIDHDMAAFAIYLDVDVYGNHAFRVQFKDGASKQANTILDLSEFIRRALTDIPGLFYLFNVETGHLMTELKPMRRFGKTTS